MNKLEIKVNMCSKELMEEIQKVIDKYEEREIKNIKDAEEYVRRSKFIKELVDKLINEKPKLKRSFIEWSKQASGETYYQKVKHQWTLIDWITMFPDNESRVVFLLDNSVFEFIVKSIAVEFIRCSQTESIKDIGLDESVELLQKFKSIV